MPKTTKQRTFFAKRKTEIAFDPESRKTFLQGFSQRKQERRAFGLAMQKVKDRKAKIEKRAERKEAMKEQMEQAEQQKAAALEGMMAQNEFMLLKLPAPVEPQKVDNVKLYQDTETKSCWGGEVIVTTSTKMPGDSSDDDDDNDDDDDKQNADAKKTNNKKNKRNPPATPKRKDEAQEFAGNVERFIQELKGNMPGKKKKQHNKDTSTTVFKGKHGAAKMKGMGGTADIKAAQRILKQAQGKGGRGRGGGGKRGGRGGGKGGRR